MKRALVIGGAGFLGSHLCERLLDDGDQVVCLDDFSSGRDEHIAHLRPQPRFELIRHDASDPIVIEVDRIYDLVCASASPLLGMALEVGARLLLASTHELHRERCVEVLAASYQYGVEARVAHIFDSYGPRMHEAGVASLVIQALRGEPITLCRPDDPVHSLCHVSDLIEGLVTLMELPADPGPVDLGYPSELTCRALAELVVELTGSPSRIVPRLLPAEEPASRLPDVAKARRALGWFPTVPIEDGLPETILYFRGRMAEGARDRGDPRERYA